jgi:cytochrome o ubiquinol oxidase subunit 1
MFGKLTWAAIPLNEPIPLATVCVLIVGIVGILALVTWKGWWP